MEIIGKISKGTKMDQIYISKERIPGFEIGRPVLIKPIQKFEIRPFYYQVNTLEPVKNLILRELFNYLEHLDNVIITGSFLEKGFEFKDIDIILITNEKLNLSDIKGHIKEEFGIEAHILSLSYKELLEGLSTDPLFELMLSQFVSKKRIIFNKKKRIDYKLLDLHLLKSKTLIDSFEFLSGKEKYKLIRNLIAILLFLGNKKINYKSLNLEIEKQFGDDAIQKIKENRFDKRLFLKKYKSLYDRTFKNIMDKIEK